MAQVPYMANLVYNLSGEYIRAHSNVSVRDGDPVCAEGANDLSRGADFGGETDCCMWVSDDDYSLDLYDIEASSDDDLADELEGMSAGTLKRKREQDDELGSPPAKTRCIA